MSPDEERLRCLFGNRLEELQQAIVRAREFLERHQIRGRAAYGVNLAIEELAVNVIRHGYDDAGPHSIELCLDLLPGQVAVELVDDGHPFDPLTVPEPDVSSAVEDREPGGLGISLVRQLARELRYERRDGKNRVTVLIDRDA